MIQIKSLNFSFKKGNPILSDLDMTLQPGRTYGLFGLNGAGKSTLLNLMSGMLFPESGQCEVLGSPTKERLPETMSEIFVVPEQFDLPGITPQEYIDLHAPFYPAFDREEMDRLCEEFVLESGTKLLSEHSLGQRKKFLISFALATNARILLMDEPTNGLDIPSKSRFRKVMASASTEERCTVISTHQVRDLEAMIDRFTVLHMGVVIFDHTIESILETLSIVTTHLPETTESIYHEEILGGTKVLKAREPDDPDSPIDLEFLFSAVIEKSDKLNPLFQNGATS
ncbi:MAG: ABC transporter ATP-binding protein [Balneolaceae bacterium]|nr:ABC transporter ATP-binding protein [Balneolaceae bacterium]MCH8550040.1 ABC transporter ATP-binding protein [Balneolaceae bacterium]